MDKRERQRDRDIHLAQMKHQTVDRDHIARLNCIILVRLMFACRAGEEGTTAGSIGAVDDGWVDVLLTGG